MAKVVPPFDQPGHPKSIVHGTGLKLAKGVIKAGREFHSENPRLEVQGWDLNSPENSPERGSLLEQLFDDVSTALKEFLDGTANVPPSPEMTNAVVGTFWRYAYAFPPNAEASTLRLFRQFALINHSCLPNAVMHWSTERQQVVLRAVREISHERKDEITVSYIDQFQPRAQRHADFGFTCVCEVCEMQGTVGLDGEESFVKRSTELRELTPFELSISRTTPKGWSFFQLRYHVMSAGGLYNSSESVRKDWIEAAFSNKVREMEMLWVCFGLHHPRTNAVVLQTFKLAEGSSERKEKLYPVVKKLGGVVTVIMGGGSGPTKHAYEIR
ncbi:Vacuolar protein sorting-associated protein 16 [Saxophila tyrrhenica]|uniref:Vacuolar protein sorting-associated protein 16 n=1 Tax=Saxophila tyrrhenica TaxID=1690608 RepID=A0AAV9PAE6_9PEZI|nr:Vacuolar protein sorting-associated protein 16 [Saxophila tyrrhenica]